jgi:hypothetical protein
VVGLVLLAAAVVALVLGVSAWRESSAADAAYAARAKLAIMLGILGIITSTTLTFWLLV